MSHLVLLISYAYSHAIKTYEKESNGNKGRELRRCFRENKSIFISLMVIIVLTLLYMFVYNNHFIFLMVYVLTLVTFVVIINFQVDKKMRMKSLDNYNRYKKKIEILRKLLKNDFNLYSKEKVKRLISYCDEVSEEHRFKTGISDLLVNIVKFILAITVAVIPAIIPVIISSKEYELFSVVVIVLVLLLIVVPIIVLPLSLMKEFLGYFLNSTSNNIQNLKGVLTALYFIDFEDGDIIK